MNKSAKRLFIYSAGFLILIIGLFIAGRIGGMPSGQQASIISNIKVGEEAPDFSLKSIDGELYTLSEFNGKNPVLIEFFSVWCSHCQNQTKANKEIFERNNEFGLVFFGINSSEYGRNYSFGNRSPITEEDLEWFKNKFNVEEPILFDKGEVARTYGFSGIPAFVLIGKDRNVKWMQSGEVSAEVLQSEIDKVL